MVFYDDKIRLFMTKCDLYMLPDSLISSEEIFNYLQLC